MWKLKSLFYLKLVYCINIKFFYIKLVVYLKNSILKNNEIVLLDKFIVIYLIILEG